MDLKKLISKGESETLEFKESLQLKDEIGETISAFSNSNGGIILIGVSDKKKIKGIQIGKKTTIDLAEYIKRNTDPQIFPEIKVRKIDNKNIVSIKIEESDEKPVFFKNYVFKRVSNTSQRISSSEIRRLAKESGAKTYWDEQICKDAKLKDIDWEFVKEDFIPLYEKISERKTVSTLQSLLESLGCIKGKKPTNAGILLFGKDPQRFFMNVYIALARYKGKEIGIERLDYKEFNGNLFQEIDKCDEYLKEHIAVMSKLLPYQVQRQDIPEYGLFSIRELITNTVCHRDYENQHTKIIIKIFSNKIEFYNPGGLPENITPRNIAEKQYSRNPVIAKVLAKVKYIEELGEGWNKIIKEYKAHPLKPKMPKIKSDRYTSIVTIFSTKDKFVEKKEIVELNDRQRKAIEFLKEKQKITNREYVNLLQGAISGDTALNDLRDMIKKGIISLKKRGRNSYYVIR